LKEKEKTIMKKMNPLKQFFLELISKLYNPYLRSPIPAVTNDGGSYDYYTEIRGEKYRVSTSLRMRNFLVTPDGYWSKTCTCGAKLSGKTITASSAFGGGENSDYRVIFCPICDGEPPSSAGLTFYPIE
jgi:hypothetical protein